MPTSIGWKNLCELCHGPMDVYVRTHCCETTCSLIVLYNELNSLDMRFNRPVEPGHAACAGCVPTQRQLFECELTGTGWGRNRSRSVSERGLLEWMSRFNQHFSREDCLLDLPTEVTAKITHLGSLVIHDDRNEIILRHTLYMDDGDR